jgi:hypothetical protein
MSGQIRQWFGAVVVILVIGSAVLAHPMMVKGTVAAVEPSRIQVKTGEEKKGETPAWILINNKTKILRDKAEVTYDQAKIKIDERVVVNADHDAKGVMTAMEIHLAAAK